MIGSEKILQCTLPIGWCFRKAGDDCLHLFEESVVVFQFRPLVIVYLPVEPSADGFSVSAVAVVDHFLCFEREGPVLLPESELAIERHVGWCGAGDIAGLVTV